MRQRSGAAGVAVKLPVCFALLGLIMLAACNAPTATAPVANDQAAAPVEAANSSLTDNGLYRISFTSALDPIGINQLHSWTLFSG